MDQNIYIYILEKGRRILERDLYLNSGSLARILKNHTSPPPFLDGNVRSSLERLVEKGQLVRHTFTRSRNFHYYSLPNVKRPTLEPKQGTNLI